jgi:hypothetical protein
LSQERRVMERERERWGESGRKGYTHRKILGFEARLNNAKKETIVFFFSREGETRRGEKDS